jgi:vitamin K-dependent gamma-carboxylase
MSSILQWLSNPISGKRLSFFRMIFGAFMVYEMLDYIKIQLVVVGFLQPGTVFNYAPFDFLEPLSAGTFKLLILSMMLSTILITIGLATRWAALFFSLSYFYIILLEKAYYNNHLYLFAILAFLLIFIDSEEHFSVSKLISKQKSRLIPRWHLFAVQLQIIIAYFYGGITKLSHDWLVKFEPVKSASKTMPQDAWYSFVKTDGGLMFYMYSGAILDLIVAPLLFHKKLKWFALPAVIIFNFLNTKTFNDIGIFPYVMLASLAIFFSSEEIGKFFSSFPKTDISNLEAAKPTSKLLGYGMGLFLVFQLIFPFRGYLFNKNLDWSGYHQSFSWRMKSMTREIVEMQWTVVDDKNQAIPITHGQMINNLQTELVARNAKAALDFARYIKAESIKRGISNPKVYAKIRVKFNGRPTQYFVKPDVDLASSKYNMSNTELWLEPLKE